MYKVVLWDIDGTLLDFKAAQSAALNSLFARFKLGKLSSEMMKDYDHINHSYWEKLEKNQITKNEVLINRFKDFFGKYNIDFSPEKFNSAYQESLGDTCVYFENAKKTVEILKENGIIQCAVTNGTKIAQDKKLKNSGLINVLDDVFISDNIGFEKPSREFFEPVFNKLSKYEKEEILIVGDSLTSDIQGGNNVGLDTCWFNPNDQVNNTDLRIDYEIKNIKEVLAIVLKKEESFEDILMKIKNYKPRIEESNIEIEYFK